MKASASDHVCLKQRGSAINVCVWCQTLCSLGMKLVEFGGIDRNILFLTHCEQIKHLPTGALQIRVPKGKNVDNPVRPFLFIMCYVLLAF